eukprot:2508317-Prymnesium_polylepis.1
MGTLGGGHNWVPHASIRCSSPHPSRRCCGGNDELARGVSDMRAKNRYGTSLMKPHADWTRICPCLTARPWRPRCRNEAQRARSVAG